MKRIISQICALAAAVSVLFATGCDKTSVNESIPGAPVIEAFTPEAAPVGAEIIVTGQNLNNVTKAFIGGQEVTIKEKVSNQRMTIIAGAASQGGKIALENAVGRGESAKSFTYSYAVPELTVSLIQSSVDMGNQMLLAGKNLSSVITVLFTAEGYTKANEAAIIERTASELIVRVPYVEADKAQITLRYFDGASEVTTPLETAPAVEVKRYKPQFDAVTLQRTAVGKTVTLTGAYLDKVGRILVNGFEAQLSKQPTTLIFTVPAGDFPDGDTRTTLKAEYFDGHESYTISEAFDVFVPFVKFWENMRSFAQGRDVESLSSFFSPETGLVYANSDWRAKVDPISYKNGANTCSASNTPNKAVITEAEYLSVNPYFFFSGVGGGQLQINSPANSTGQLKNFYTANNSADEFRVTGANGNWYGTAVLTFRTLDPGNTVEKELIDKVKNQTLEQIDEAIFPIDTELQTVGGIGIKSAAGSPNSDDWAAGKFEKGVNADNVNVDAVLMVLYYGYDGSKVNVAANIRRIGFLHIRTVNFRMYNNTAAPSSSDVTFNCYWQKYDYDYSKIVK